MVETNERTLADRIDLDDAAACHAWLDRAERLEAIHTLSHLSDERREKLLTLLSPAAAADVIEQLPEPQVLEAIEHLQPETAAQILSEMHTDEQADIIGELDAAEANAILDEMPLEDRATSASCRNTRTTSSVD